MAIKSQVNQKIALLAVFVSALLAGGVSPFSKIILNSIPPLTYTFIRFTIALIILLSFVGKKIKISRKELPVLLLSLLSTANIMLFAYGVKRTTATVAQALYSSVPIIAVILSAKLLKEKITLNKIAGVLFGFSGFLILILLPLLEQKSVFRGDLLGNLLIFTGVVSYSFYTVLSKKFQKQYSPAQLTTYFFLTTFLVQLFFFPIEFITYPPMVVKN